jgi:hypothetical protein
MAVGFADRRLLRVIRPVFGRAWPAPATIGVVASGGER